MEWFKILLLTWLGLDIIEYIIMSSGWKPKTQPWQYAAEQLFVTLIFVGVWLWL